VKGGVPDTRLRGPTQSCPDGSSPVRASPFRWRILRHYSLQSLPDTAAALRHVTGSPGLGLLRRLRPTPDRPADGVPSPQFHAGRVTPGQTRGGSRVHLKIARRRRHPTRPLRHRRGYPAARHHGLLSVPPTLRQVPRLRDRGDGCASPPAQIRQVRAGASLRDVERRFLAYALPPRSPHPRRLARWVARFAAVCSGSFARPSECALESWRTRTTRTLLGWSRCAPQTCGAGLSRKLNSAWPGPPDRPGPPGPGGCPLRRSAARA